MKGDLVEMKKFKIAVAGVVAAGAVVLGLMAEAAAKPAPAFSPRMVHSAFGIDDYPDDYLAGIAKTGVDSILVYISDPPDVTRTGRHEDIGALVARAARFGIGVYAYADFPVKAAKLHPSEPGAEDWYDQTYGAIVRQTPGLKGLICVGESVAFPYADHRPVNYWWKPCPDGAKSTGFRPDPDWADWLRLVTKVTRKYNPSFDVVFWTYNWYRAPEAERVALLERIPTDVSLLVTFEMGDPPLRRCGLDTGAYMDYSIVRPGPSRMFRSEAAVAKRRGIRLYAMTNTGGRTWDFGLLPYEPVPWRWKARLEAIRAAKAAWGLSGLMESHHYGFRPNFIAELATKVYADDYRPEDFERILREFAVRDYGAADADAVMGAWKDFSDAFDWHPIESYDQATVLRNGPVYPFCAPEADIPDPLHPIYEYHDGVKHGCGWKFTATTFSFPLERIPGELEMAARELAFLESGCKRLEGRTGATRRLWAMGRFMQATIRTSVNAKRYYRAGVARQKGELLAILKDEEANVRSCFDWVDVDETVGWEPMMGRVVARDTLDWKLGQLKAEAARVARELK